MKLERQILELLVRISHQLHTLILTMHEVEITQGKFDFGIYRIPTYKISIWQK